MEKERKRIQIEFIPHVYFGMGYSSEWHEYIKKTSIRIKPSSLSYLIKDMVRIKEKYKNWKNTGQPEELPIKGWTEILCCPIKNSRNQTCKMHTRIFVVFFIFSQFTVNLRPMYLLLIFDRLILHENNTNFVKIRQYINENFVSEGMCADLAIHDTDGHNPHVHIILTVRPWTKMVNGSTRQKKEYLCIWNRMRVFY